MFPDLQSHPEFRTERLILNLISPADAEDILQLRSDERVNRYIDRDPMSRLEESHAFIEKVLTNIANQTSYYWAIRIHPETRLIGTSCLFNLDPEVMSAELGYELIPEFQGKGIMREAVATVIRFAEDVIRIQRLDAWIHEHNQPSLKLAAHFSFVRNPELEEQHRDLPELSFLRIYSRYTGPGGAK